MLVPGQIAKPRKARRPARNHIAIATQFEEDVLSGKFPCGRMFRAAIERQRRDVATPPDGYVWAPEIGAKMCRLMEQIPFGGEGPKRGTPFVLEPFQVWIVLVLFGWMDPVTGFRRFRVAHIWMPKGNGKSPFAALIALCVLILGGGGEKIYSAASAQKQARLVFDGAREMLHLAPHLATRFGLVVEEHKIKGAGDSRVYEPVSSEAGTIEGIRPSLLILDEVHVLPNRKLFDNLKSAANKVDGSLFVTISTAGFDMSPEAIGWQVYTRTRNLLERKTDDPTVFALIIEADRIRDDKRPADPRDFNMWREANPNLGVSVSVVGLKSALQSWIDEPSERPSLEVKHLGWWQQTASQFLDVRRWNELGDPNLRLEDCDGSEWAVVLGIDLARTRDLTVLVILAVRMMPDGRREYRVFTRNVYLAADSVTVKQNPEIREWSKGGWIELLPAMTYAPLKAKAIEVGQAFGNVEACIDRWSAAEVEADLEAGGLTIVEVAQGAQSLSEPMKELEAAVMDGRIHHDGSPVAAMCVGNLQADLDRNGNIRPTRENEYKKIDVAVALIDALYRGMVIDPPSSMTVDWV